jgi:vacuolar-type H+-ATPase subunit H
MSFGIFIFDIFLDKNTKKKKKEILEKAREISKKIIKEAEMKAEKIIEGAMRKREEMIGKRRGKLKILEEEISKKKEEVVSLKRKLSEIEKLLKETKLGEFSEYLREEINDLNELREMVIILDSETSFSSRIVQEERIRNKIQILLNRSRRMQERLSCVI